MDFFKIIENHYQEKMPFVVFHKPNSEDVILVTQNDSETYYWESDADSGFVFCDFLGNKKLLLPQEKCNTYFQKVSSISFVSLNTAAKLSQKLSAKEAFEKLVFEAINEIKSESFNKVVLSRKEIQENSTINLEILFCKMVSNYFTAFSYCFFHPSSGLWIGATPEQLIKVEGTNFKTVALAGTKKWSETEEIIWTEKEKTEQNLVTKSIENCMEGFATKISISQVYNFKAGDLAHLKSDFNIELKENFSIQKLVSALHPTPAVCGLPKQEALDFILKNEKYDREFYTGFLGELNRSFKTMRMHESDLFVNLRCMKLEDNKAEIFVGCGITAESNPESEFLETQNKAMTMRKVL
ncbi:MAG: isochorismate synthase [Flavobacterium sp.]|jgi:isochorismate synthase